MIDLHHAIVLGVLLFAVGLYGALRTTNAVRILMCIELMLNAVNLNFVSFARLAAVSGTAQAAVPGQVFAIFVMTVAAAEVAVGLAIILQIVRQRGVVHIDRINLLKG
ncbi:MAG: NADH-quinone oxidoreductase subunit NuoK [Bacillota bacterium]